MRETFLIVAYQTVNEGDMCKGKMKTYTNVEEVEVARKEVFSFPTDNEISFFLSDFNADRCEVKKCYRQ